MASDPLSDGPPYARTRVVVRIRDARDRRFLPQWVAEELVGARVRAGLTQNGLAARTAMVAARRQRSRSRKRGVVVAGVSQQTISALERGERAPSTRSARLITEALGLGRMHSLRRGLFRSASRSRRRGLRARQAVRRSPLLRVGTRLLDRSLAHLVSQLDDAEAERQRQIGERTHRGGRPRAW